MKARSSGDAHAEPAAAPAAPPGPAAAPRAWLATAAVAGSALALFLAFVGYGFNLDDEGTILYQILRTHRGERPYLDFHTGYTPAMFYLNAALFSAFGVSALPVRVVLALVNALAAGITFRLALRVAPPVEAGLAALAYALCMPVFAGQFAAFNIPYPAWYAVAAWLAASLASVKAEESGRRAWLLGAGVAAGLAFSFKPNTGVLCLGAVVLARLLAGPPLAGAVGALLEGGLLVVAALAACFVLGLELATLKFVLLGLPLVAMLLGGLALRARRRGRGGPSRPVRTALGDALTIVAGFVLVNAVWMLYFLPQLGFAGFGREILLLGAGVERIYGLEYPEPSLWALVAVALAIAVACAPEAIARGWIGSRAIAGLVAASVIALAVMATASALAPEGLVISVAMQVENLAFFLLPAILAGAVLRWIWGPRTPVPTALLVFAPLLFIQVYPRIDFMHVVISMPSALVVAAGALAAAERRWVQALEGAAPALRRDRLVTLVRAGAVVPIALVLSARAAPFAEARLRLMPTPGLRPSTTLEMPALPVSLERDRDHDLRELAAVARFVARETRPDDSILVFPALAMVPFLADRRTPVPHDYFFPGRPSHADEAMMLEQIEAARPPLAVTLNDRMGYFSASPSYYFLLRDYMQRSYVLVRRFGRFDVLMRRDLVAERENTEDRAPSLGGALSTTYARGRYRDEIRRARWLARHGTVDDLADSATRLADADRLVRRARVLAIEAVAARLPRGLTDVEEVIARDRRSRLLLVRALGEFGGVSALPYLRATYAGGRASEPRLAREAATAINYILARELARRYAWKGVEKGPLWPLPAGLLDEGLVLELDDFDTRQRIGGLVALSAVADGRTDLAPALEPVRHPRDTAWWRVLSSYALVKMGRTEYLHSMLGPMRDGTFAEQYVPSIVLDPGLVEPAAASALVEDLLLRGGTARERETAAWMAPFLSPPPSEAAMRAAEEDTEPAVRTAGSWARERLRRGTAGGAP